jgi:hypothetical protein
MIRALLAFPVNAERSSAPARARCICGHRGSCNITLAPFDRGTTNRGIPQHEKRHAQSSCALLFLSTALGWAEVQAQSSCGDAPDKDRGSEPGIGLVARRAVSWPTALRQVRNCARAEWAKAGLMEGTWNAFEPTLLGNTSSHVRICPMNDPVLKDTLIGEEWMALRQIAVGAKAAAIPRSVRTRLEVLDLIARDDYGQLMLTEKGRRLIATAN